MRLTAEVLRADEPMKALALKRPALAWPMRLASSLVRIVKELTPSQTDRPERAADAPDLPLAA